MTIPVALVSPDPDVVDAALEAYVRWREACADVREAYRRWLSAGKTDRMLQFVVYTAALDREEIAASVYASAMRQLNDECVDAWRAEPRRVWGAKSRSCK